VLLLVLVLENSRYLTVTLIERSSAGRFGPCFDAGSQQIEHEHEHDQDLRTSFLLRSASEFRCFCVIFMRFLLKEMRLVWPAKTKRRANGELIAGLMDMIR
jgi:hypothetical protein